MRLITTWSVMLSMILSLPVSLAADPAPIQADAQHVAVRNVELSATGLLSGQCLSMAGQPVAEMQVLIKSGDVVQVVTTDAAGRFIVSDLTTGQCTLQVEDDLYVCRVWRNGTAPPKSLQSIAIVSEDVSVLGNNFEPGSFYPRGRLMALSTSQKTALGLLSIAGAGIVIAVSQNDDAS